MFKLLTEKQKKKVLHEYNMHRVIVLLSGLVLVLIIGVTGLLPSYILSNSREKEVLERIRIMDIYERNEEGLESQSWLSKMNVKLKTLSPSLDTDRPSDFIKKILEHRVSGVKLTDFSWVKVDGVVTLSVNGIALDRKTLIKFENNIDESEDFSEVTLPISNLAKDKDIDFQLKLSLATTTISTPTQAP